MGKYASINSEDDLKLSSRMSVAMRQVIGDKRAGRVRISLSRLEVSKICHVLTDMMEACTSAGDATTASRIRQDRFMLTVWGLYASSRDKLVFI